MKNKKDLILDSALDLFSENGYHATSTKLIADKAGVSEALIFKFFKSKDALLEKVITSGYRSVVLKNKNMLTEKDPVKFIHRIIDIPFELLSSQPKFWKLQARLFTFENVDRHYQLFLKPFKTLAGKSFSGFEIRQS